MTITREVAVQVERALSPKLSAGLRKALNERCAGTLADQDEAETRQLRTARAAGSSAPLRGPIRPLICPPLSRGSKRHPVWALTVIGKRRKQCIGAGQCGDGRGLARPLDRP